MCVNNLSKVALDSAAAGIEPATSSRKSNALTTAPPSHTELVKLNIHYRTYCVTSFSHDHMALTTCICGNVRSEMGVENFCRFENLRHQPIYLLKWSVVDVYADGVG